VALTRLLDAAVMLCSPFSDEPIRGREAALQAIETSDGLADDDS
jgi:hypothetical protein